MIEKTPWEKLNISEYDWYHKPVHNWMRVDYNVSNCNTVSNCEALCMKDAEELAYTENVSCIQVYSYSNGMSQLVVYNYDEGYFYSDKK